MDFVLASLAAGLGLLLGGWALLRSLFVPICAVAGVAAGSFTALQLVVGFMPNAPSDSVSYTHLRAHET